MGNIIEFDNVSFRYEADIEGEMLPLAVDSVSLGIEQGSFVAVLGHNGSGKSTLAKLTNAINIPESGKVTVDGMDTSDEKLTDAIRRTVGMVFQNPDNQIVATIVEDDVAFGPENLGVPPAEIRQRVDDALKAVNMFEFRKSEPHKLSGGQKQRVAIAGVIAMQTSCIVLDEPTAMLDPNGRREVIATIKKLNKEMGITVILVTHFMDEAVQADRVVVMDKGRIIMDGTPREVFSESDRLIAVGLDVPQATQLAAALIKKGVQISSDLLDENECIDAVCELLRSK
ncbi:MAG: energy-coupling factor transporter ATPase [Clostridia bacterium]|nr:energy-coupling factor transporter ATPase [Clostridia bacterium]